MRGYARALNIEARDDLGRLLEKKKFWKRKVFDEFIKETTELLYTNGEKAYALAKLGPALAELVAAESGDDPNVLKVRAFNLLGNAYRVLGRFRNAEEAYDQADALPAPETEHADTDRRRAYLRDCQGKAEEGHDFAHRAVETYKTSGDLVDRHPLGLALAARGQMHYQCGRLGPTAVDLSAATAMINHRTKPRIFYYALHNLSVILVEVMAPERLGNVLRKLDASYNRFVGAKRHIAKYKIHWLKALAEKRFGATRHAERLFKKAFNGFVDLKASTEMSLISLDIALLFIEENRFDEARNLAGNAYKIASALGMNTDALAAVKLWKDTTEAELTPEFLVSIRATVVENAQPYGV